MGSYIKPFKNVWAKSTNSNLSLNTKINKLNFNETSSAQIPINLNFGNKNSINIPKNIQGNKNCNHNYESQNNSSNVNFSSNPNKNFNNLIKTNPFIYSNQRNGLITVDNFGIEEGMLKN